MQVWRRVALLSVLGWVLAVGTWANRSWTDSVPVVPPPGSAAEPRPFRCSAPLAPRTATPLEPGGGKSGGEEHPLSRAPCRANAERGVLAVVDVGLGALLLLLLVCLGVRRGAAKGADRPAPTN